MKACTNASFCSGRYLMQNEMDNFVLVFACSDHAVYAGWNTMFFLWGVFRVKKVRCMQPQDIPVWPVDNVKSGNISLDGELTASKESGFPLVNGNVDSKASQVCKGDSADANVEHLEPSFMSFVPTSHMNFAPDRRQIGTFQVLLNFIIFA